MALTVSQERNVEKFFLLPLLLLQKMDVRSLAEAESWRFLSRAATSLSQYHAEEGRLKKTSITLHKEILRS